MSTKYEYEDDVKQIYKDLLSASKIFRGQDGSKLTLRKYTRLH